MDSAVLVVLDHEQHGQLPDRGQVHRLVEVAFAGAAVAGERRRHARLAPELRGQRQAVGHRQHRPEVADHAHDVVLERAEVERPVAALREAAVPPKKLAEQRAQVEPAAREHAEVAVHRQDPVVRAQRRRHAHRDRLLADAGEPLREPSLPEQDQHLLLHQAREEQSPVERPLSPGIERPFPGGDRPGLIEAGHGRWRGHGRLCLGWWLGGAPQGITRSDVDD